MFIIKTPICKLANFKKYIKSIYISKKNSTPFSLLITPKLLP